MELCYTAFDEPNAKEVCACFDYSGSEGYKVTVWVNIQKQGNND
jgi:hypothetical protein